MNYKEIFKTFILSACTVMMAGCSSTVILESERFMSAFRKDVPFALDSLTQIGEGKWVVVMDLWHTGTLPVCCAMLKRRKYYGYG